QNGCLMVVPVLRLGIHPEMERPAILNRSTPLIEGSVMSIPADLSMRYAIYTFEKQYTRWGATFPGNFVPVLTSERKCSCRIAKPAHFGCHLPASKRLLHFM